MIEDETNPALAGFVVSEIPGNTMLYYYAWPGIEYTVPGIIRSLCRWGTWVVFGISANELQRLYGRLVFPVSSWHFHLGKR